MNIKSTLYKTLEYIDCHITEDITLEELSAIAGFSPRHFDRIFKLNVCNNAVGYIKQRKLVFAAYEIRTGAKILDTAIRYGFETHSGFSKAFKRSHGCSPETYRIHMQNGNQQKPELPKIIEYTIGGTVMEPNFVEMDSFKLAGYVLRTKMENSENMKSIPAFWGDYMSSGKMQKLHSENFHSKNS